MRRGTAKDILSSGEYLVTSDHVLVETWVLCGNASTVRLRSNSGRASAPGPPRSIVTVADLEVAWLIALAFGDQDFPIVDRTSFALMQRLGIVKAATFDNDFAVFRYGRHLTKAFQVVR